MAYSQSQITDLKTKIIRKIDAEIRVAQRNNTLDELLEKYGIELEEITYQSGVTKRSKILVLGQLPGKVKDYQMVAKKLGINENNLEFIDYAGAKHLSAERLRYSCEYSDIICGPIPHKVEGMGDTSSLIAEIERNPSEYPKLIKATISDCLKFSITGFKEYISKTRYFKEIVGEY